MVWPQARSSNFSGAMACESRFASASASCISDSSHSRTCNAATPKVSKAKRAVAWAQGETNACYDGDRNREGQ